MNQLTDCTLQYAAPLEAFDLGMGRKLRALAGHLWTVAPVLKHGLFGSKPGFGKPFTTVVQDSTIGEVRLSGILDEPTGGTSVMLIVHGHGSNAHSPQCTAMARAAHDAGLASLRLSLRGADLSGEDIYHGGLTDDLRAALCSPELRGYRKVFLAGYSVGGQIVMRAALDNIDSRIRSVAAICAPLDLAAGADEFDRPSRRLYRSHVFAGMNLVYEAAAARRPMPTPVEAVRRAQFTRERDELTVVPRFAFRSADDYYTRVQVAYHLDRLNVPSLLVASENDPLVPIRTLRAAIDGASNALEVARVNAGGHMFFPGDLHLGQPGRPGLEHQVTQWLLSNQ